MDAKLAILVAVLAGSAPPAAVPIEAKGRVAGKTQRCLPGPRDVIFDVSSSDPSLLLHDDGKGIWVTQVGPGCHLEAGQTVIPDTLASYYCSGDLVRLGGARNLFPASSYCALGNFTPFSAAK